MTVKELLERLRRDLLHDRTDRVDGDDDALWTDDALVSYLDEAQRRFARKTLCLRGTLDISLAAMQDTYELDGRVIAVISGKFKGNGSYVNGVYTLNDGLPPSTQLYYPDRQDLARAGHAFFEGMRLPNSVTWDLSTLANYAPSRPLAFDTDEFVTDNGAINVRLYPLSDKYHAGSTIEFRVARLPEKLTVDKAAEQTPEIPEDYHQILMEYAAFQALRIVDHDAGDPQAARDFLSAFESHMKEARIETQRRLFAPTGFGFGRNGYTYAGN